MRKIHCILLLLCLGVCGAELPEITFSDGGPKEHIAASRGTAVTAEGLQLQSGGKNFFIVRPWRVEPGAAYQLSMEVKTTGPNNLFTKPPLEYFFKNAAKSPKLPSWSLVFKRDQGQDISRRGNYRRFLNPDEQWHVVKDQFHAPPDASALQLNISGGEEDQLTVRSLKLEKLPVDDIISLNPDFSLGEYNYSGIMTLVRGCLDRDGTGRTVLAMPNGWYMSCGIPVRGGETLRLSIDVEVPRKSTASVYFYREGKSAGKSTPVIIWKGRPGAASYDLTVPEGADEARLVAGNGIFKSIKLERINTGGISK